MKSAAKEKAIAAAATAADTDVTTDKGGKGRQVLLELTEPFYLLALFVLTPTVFSNRLSLQTTGRQAASSSLEESWTSSLTTKSGFA